MSDLTNQADWDSHWASRSFLLRRRWMLRERGWRRFLAYALRDVPPSGSLLELGCAPGRVACRHALLRPDLTLDGVDFSETGVEKARQVYEMLSMKGRLFIQDIRAELPTLYDVVCSYGLLEHFDNPQEIVACHVSHVEPGGKVIITVPNLAARPVRWALRHFAAETLRLHNLDVMSEEALKELMVNAGLVDVESGGFGGCSFPHTAENRSLIGRIYRFAGRGWNLALSLGSLFLPVEKWSPWQSMLWCTGRKRG